MSAPGIIAVALAAVAAGLLWSAPALAGRPLDTRLVGLLLGIDTGLVLVGGVALAAAAGRSWSLLGDPIDPARTADAVLQVTQTDGDGDLYALLIVVIGIVTLLTAGLLGTAARSVVPGTSAGDRAIVTSVLSGQVVIGIAAALRLLTGSEGTYLVVLALHVPLSAVALWLQHQRHRHAWQALAAR